MARLFLLFVAGMIFTAHSSLTCEDSVNPRAQIEAATKYEVLYPPNTVITDWSALSPHSYFRGCMGYQDGKLTVPATGEYYVYAQLYFHNNGRVHINVNNSTVTLLQPQVSQTDFHGSVYAGGVFQLNAGDVITITPHLWPDALGAKIYMDIRHSYFGAFMM